MSSSLTLHSIQNLLRTVADCTKAVDLFMLHNKLKMNNDKTEVMIVCSDSKQKHVNLKELDLNGNQILITSSLRNLGVQLEQNLSLDEHISKLCRNFYFVFRRVSNLKQFLNENSTKILVCSLILSRLDYCNSCLLYTSPSPRDAHESRMPSSA